MAEKTLNDLMEFDHPIEVHADGTITDAHRNIYAPSLLDGEIDSPGWEFFTTGYSGQDHYRGPIMHNSEFIGGRLEDDIRATPGIYVAVVSNYTPDDTDDPDDGELDTEGWAIVRYTGSDA